MTNSHTTSTKSAFLNSSFFLLSSSCISFLHATYFFSRHYDPSSSRAHAHRIALQMQFNLPASSLRQGRNLLASSLGCTLPLPFHVPSPFHSSILISLLRILTPAPSYNEICPPYLGGRMLSPSFSNVRIVQLPNFTCSHLVVVGLTTITEYFQTVVKQFLLVYNPMEDHGILCRLLSYVQYRKPLSFPAFWIAPLYHSMETIWAIFRFVAHACGTAYS